MWQLARLPVGKRVTARGAERVNQVANDAPASVEGFDQPLETTAVGLVPLLRNLRGNLPNIFNAHLFGARQRRLECVPAQDVLVHTIFGITAAQSGVGEVPVSRVETVPVVDEGREPPA